MTIGRILYFLLPPTLGLVLAKKLAKGQLLYAYIFMWSAGLLLMRIARPPIHAEDVAIVMVFFILQIDGLCKLGIAKRDVVAAILFEAFLGSYAVYLGGTQYIFIAVIIIAVYWLMLYQERLRHLAQASIK